MRPSTLFLPSLILIPCNHTPAAVSGHGAHHTNLTAPQSPLHCAVLRTAARACHELQSTPWRQRAVIPAEVPDRRLCRAYTRSAEVRVSPHGPAPGSRSAPGVPSPWPFPPIVAPPAT